jgi:uncharacterized repeat protein (TIGR03803 family)
MQNRHYPRTANRYFQAAYALAGILLLGLRANAQPIQPEVLFKFSGAPQSPDGMYPHAGLTLGADGNLYGTTGGGFGSGNYGTVFRFETNGTLTTLVSFDGTSGVYPLGGLTRGNDGNFYGTTQRGGTYANGATAFQLTTNATFTTLVSFGFDDGDYPFAAMTLGNDGNFYGTTSEGGNPYFDGTIFKLTPDGALTTLVVFNGTNGGSPYSALTLGNDGNFYGTTSQGGTGNNGLGGTIFRFTANGDLITLVSFNGTNGALPYARLTLGGDGNFYGTTYFGGTGGSSAYGGTVFKMTTDGQLTTLVSFAGTNGAYPFAGLTLGNDGNFYGTTTVRNSTVDTNNSGTIFAVTTNGALITLASFPFTNSVDATGDLTIGSDGNFYGTSEFGGDGYGLVYRLKHGAYIKSCRMMTNGFQVNVINVGGSGMVVLESSTDLNAWTPIQTNGPSPAQQFLDSSAGSRPMQFYRVLQH